jgi:acyl-CoA reductase-like NAD-dependent aldehyde dehydrogenase
MTQTAAGTQQLASLNPATDEVIATYPVADDVGVAAVVAAARAAAPWWTGLGYAGRKRAMLRWAARLTERADELSELIHQENGKPVEDAYLELVLTLEHIRWAAQHAVKVLRTRIVSPGLLMANHSATIERKPYGVVGVIGPWNYPIFTPNGSIAYALAAGNTVVFKPSEYTPAIGHFLADTFAEANPEAPAGVFSVITGYGETGAALCRSGVDKLAFTGSAATGRKVMAGCAQTLTPVLMECGGKDAFIVADDANVRAAAQAAAWGAVSNSGQTCVGVERVYVTRGVRDEFLAELRKVLDGIGPGSDNGAAYGPMTMPGQVDVVRRHIADALEHGGTALVGGPESVRPPYVDPVVLVDVDEDSAAVREETFGPTLTVRTVSDVDEAVRLANDTTYGLASTVFSRRHGAEIAKRIDAGLSSVNSVIGFAAVSALPFGGHGDSGFGRIHGADGLREFTRTHSISRQRFAIPGLTLMKFRRNRLGVALIRKVIKLRHGRAR